jgi:mono/diheme cytochrome c family protein
VRQQVAPLALAPDLGARSVEFVAAISCGATNSDINNSKPGERLVLRNRLRSESVPIAPGGIARRERDNSPGRFIRYASSRRTGRTVARTSTCLPGPVARVVGAALATTLAGGATVSAQDIASMDGRTLYDQACASCHGADGGGVPAERRSFDVDVPDFRDCSFASREPDADWIAVAHQGGPVRGFDKTMPAFGEALDEEALQRVMDYIRTFCGNAAWPRGELNLPRAFFLEKAYPEDEAVTTLSAALEGNGAVLNELLYERRFGARSQWESAVPFGVMETGAAGGSWEFGLGDVEVGLKHTIWHNFASGSIVALGGEVILPTGDEARGFGKGTVVFEPYISAGQILPSDAFIQGQALVEISTDDEKAENEIGWRFAGGKTFTPGAWWGRTWTPMIELVGSREMESGARSSWDVIPQMQVSLNTRQHVLLNAGVRLPATDADVRSSQLLIYILWDWFDGGFFAGW